MRELWDNPNKFARQAGIELGADNVIIHGYQEFRLTRDKAEPLPVDAPLQKKLELVGPYFTRLFLTNKTILDIGANAGFFSFLARQQGAREAISLDMDNVYLDLIRKASSHLQITGVRPVNARVQDWTEAGDLVIAFAMVHWLYSCTASYGTMDAVVGKLASLTREKCIVEWVAPEDGAIQFFKHLEWEPSISKAGYTVEAFEDGLRKHFKSFKILGNTAPTRVVYVGNRID